MASYLNYGYPIAFICTNKLCDHEEDKYLMSMPKGNITCPQCGFKTLREKGLVDCLTDKDIEEMREDFEKLLADYKAT